MKGQEMTTHNGIKGLSQAANGCRLGQFAVMGVLAGLLWGLVGCTPPQADKAAPVASGHGAFLGCEMGGEHGYIPARDIAAAKEAFTAKNYELAEILLARVLTAGPENLDALDMMTAAYVAHAWQKQAAGDSVAAFAKLKAAQAAVWCAFQNMKAQAAPSDIQRLHGLDRWIEESGEGLRQNTILDARRHIAEAKKIGKSAHYYLWPNDRDDVRQGLIHLRWVKERFEYIDTDTRADYHYVLNFLQGEVADEEWARLTAAAGFIDKP
jgi:hypothetical protein